MNSHLVRLRHRAPHINGARGVALMIGGLYAITRGVAYLPPLIPNPTYVPGSLNLIAAFIPLQVWGGFWVIVGLLCIICAFRKEDGLAWGFLCGMGIAWGSSYLIGSIMDWVNGDPGREWIAAGSYIFPAVIFAILSARIPDKAK